MFHWALRLPYSAAGFAQYQSHYWVVLTSADLKTEVSLSKMLTYHWSLLLTFGFWWFTTSENSLGNVYWFNRYMMPDIHKYLVSPPLILLLSLDWIHLSVSPSVMAVVRFYSNEALSGRTLQRAAKLYPHLSISTELCYNVELTGECVTLVSWWH